MHDGGNKCVTNLVWILHGLNFQVGVRGKNRN